MNSAVRMLLVAAAFLSLSGCGKPVLRLADASLGDYYTEAEWKKLSQEQRDEYCAELARQDSLYRAEIGETRGILTEIEERRIHLRSEADSLTREALSLEARLAEARSNGPRGGRGSGAPGHGNGEGIEEARSARVRPGDSLWRLAARDSALRDGRAWTRIFEANRDKIRDPNLIFPGQEITIPR